MPYAYPVLRALECEICRRGDAVAWFVEQGCPVMLEEGDVRLLTPREVEEYNPLAVFAASNYIPDFFPGVKVNLLHGYAINKRNLKNDGHFTVRGWFDIYCSQGPANTPGFEAQAQKYGCFRVYETGWPKADVYFSPEMQRLPANRRPVVLYSSTFTPGISSTTYLADEIERLVATRDWDWIFMFHPKLTDPEILGRYERIACEHANVTFLGNTFSADAMRRADVLLSDSSSIILEFMFLNKPVVTFRNTTPGPHLIDVDSPGKVAPALERALLRPEELMSEIRNYTMHYEPHRDCRCSARVLDAVDDFVVRGYKGLKRKPLNLVRKMKLRRRMHYPVFRGLFRG